MKLGLYSKSGQKTKDIAVSLKNSDLKPEAISDYINYIREGIRQPISNSKDRSEVRGGGKKPWRQKGTGNARAGSNRSPLWRGGGVTFGPTSERGYKNRINKIYKSRIKDSIIGNFIKNNKAMIIEDPGFKTPNTKKAQQLIENLDIDGNITLVVDKGEKSVIKSFNNIPFISICYLEKFDILNLISSNYLIFTEKGYQTIMEREKKIEKKKDEKEKERK